MTTPLGQHNFRGGVPAGSLSASVDDSVESIPINTIVTASWPPAPFKVTLDQGEATEESMLVTDLTATSLTVTRGYDNTTGYAHANGATFFHGPDAAAMQDMANHVYDTTRNDHTQYQLEADLVAGYGLGSFPTPAVGLTTLDGKLSTDVTLTGSATTVVMATQSLAIGTWLVFAKVTVTMPSASTGILQIDLLDNSATASIFHFTSKFGNVAGVESLYTQLESVALVNVSSAGTLNIRVNNGATGSATAKSGSNNNAFDTGYIAVRIA